MVRNFQLRDKQGTGYKTMTGNKQRELAGVIQYFHQITAPASLWNFQSLVHHFQGLTEFMYLFEIFFNLKQNNI